MSCFSVPYNNDDFLLNRMQAEFSVYWDRLNDMYFPVPPQVMNTGRTFYKEKEDYANFVALALKINKAGLKTNVLMNPSCIHNGVEHEELIQNVISFLKHVMVEAPIDILTVSDFLLAKSVKSIFPAIRLECSVNAYANTTTKMQYWSNAGCDVMIIPPDMNKNITFIRGIKNRFPNMKLKIMVNEDCLGHCPIRCAHNNAQSHGQKTEVYIKSCSGIFKEKPWLFYSSTFIPPKYLSFYEDTIDIYKLLDRQMGTEKIIRTIGAYLSHPDYQEKYDDYNSRIPESIFEAVLCCERDCENCNKCYRAYRDDSISSAIINNWVSAQ